jgi:ADP-ribosyl-[dinitrogen reductase] hydrolase
MLMRIERVSMRGLEDSRHLPKTNLSHPLRIDHVDAPSGGVIGMTFCPGRKGIGAFSGTWDRDLVLYFDRIRDWGALAVVTL